MHVTFTDGTTQAFEDKSFAQGGQGVIYKSLDGQHVLKIYNPLSSTPARAKQVEGIIGTYNPVREDPYWEQVFTWPDKMTRAPRLGVRMRMVKDLTRIDSFFYKAFYERLPAEKKGWWIGRIAVAIKLARAVDRMSTLSLCHSDLSDKNVMVDAFDGRMTILDCDSIVIPDVIPPDVLGTPGYMAPELVSGAAREPSVVTDRHALAVLLYRWLVYKHPLIGPKLHSADPDEDERLMFGEKALYIEHPSDTSNQPPKLRMTTDMLTPRVKHLFHQAFVDGLHQPGLRPTANLWEDALVELFDRVLPCANASCGQRFFVAQQAGPLRCTNCGTPVSLPGEIPWFRLTHPVQHQGIWQYTNDGRHGRYFVGWPERPLHVWHAYPATRPSRGSSGQPPDPRPVAYIRFDAPTRTWYLQNVSLPDMRAARGADAQPDWKPVPPGHMLPLETGVQVLFGEDNIARRAFVEMRPTGVDDPTSVFGKVLNRPAELSWPPLPPTIVAAQASWPSLQVDTATRRNISSGYLSLQQGHSLFTGLPVVAQPQPSAPVHDVYLRPVPSRAAIEFPADGAIRRLPVYLVLDTSGAMRGTGIENVHAGVKAIYQTLLNDPRSTSTAQISLITFGDVARRETFTTVPNFAVPTLTARGCCAYGEALRAVNESLDTDILPNRSGQKGDFKPVIVLMVGGAPADHWQAEALRLARRQRNNLIHIHGVSLGPDVDLRALHRTCGNVLTWDQLTPDWLARQFELVSVAIQSTGQP